MPDPTFPDDHDAAIDLRVVDRERLAVDFQPIVDLADGSVVGAEALVRWEHPTYGHLDAAEFLDLAVNASVRSVLVERSVVIAAGAWADLGARVGGRLPDLYLNVDLDHLADLVAVERFRHVLVACDLPPEHVVVDLVTTSASADPAPYRPALRALTDLGVRLALDDMGRTPASLWWLRELPLTIVKIDPVLVRGAEVDERAGRLLGHLATLAADLDLDAIVEGVETSAEDAVVRTAGFRYAQGRHYGRPGPIESLTLEAMTGVAGVDR